MWRIILLIGIYILFSGPVKSQINEPPKLFVGIVIDQMREDFLLRFYNQFSEDGFKKLVNEGALCRNVHYNYTPTITAVGHTSIYSGTTPRYHGIIGNSWYNRSTNSVIYCIAGLSPDYGKY